MRETVCPHFVEMLVRHFDEFIIPTVQFFIIPALHICILPCWHVHFISVRLHSHMSQSGFATICSREKEKWEKRGGGKASYTHISSPFLGGEHFVPLHNLSFAYKRRSLWVLVHSCTNPRHSYTKCMRMRRSLWCLQNRVDEAKTNTKQLLCAPLANGE